MSQWTNEYLSVYSFFYGAIPGIRKLSDELKSIVSEANLFMLDTLRLLADKFESGNYQTENDMELEEIKKSIDENHKNSLKTIYEIIGKVELYSLTKDFLRI